jgi:ribosome-associated toxin RatA of RatAB toxin-antitoxin module
MRKVEVKGETSLSKEQIWRLITDLERYPKHVKFVKTVSFNKPLALKSQFSDITTIAYIPLKVTHTVDVFEKEKSLGFYVKMPLTGHMIQRVNISSRSDKRELHLSIEFDFQNRLFDLAFGRFLEKRINEMLLYILESEKFLNGKS